MKIGTRLFVALAIPISILIALFALPAPRDPRRDGELWAIVLAGGEGRRLEAFTTRGNGITVPKQFCQFRDDRTLLTVTLERAQRLVPKERVVVVVLDRHRRWWERDLEDLPTRNVLSQPENRGTAVAILHALVEIHLRDQAPQIVVMPSDHDVDREDVLLRSIRLAHDTAKLLPEDVVLLGVVPSHLDSGYGLIVPEASTPGTSHRVRYFLEKPPLTLASRLIRGGALWNSFIFASSGSALYERFEDTVPSLARGYLQGLGIGSGDRDAFARLYAGLPEHDFSRDVLQRSASRLRLVAVPKCGWTDLGTPARLASWLDRHREARFWKVQGLSRIVGSTGIPGPLSAGGTV